MWRLSRDEPDKVMDTLTKLINRSDLPAAPLRIVIEPEAGGARAQLVRALDSSILASGLGTRIDAALIALADRLNRTGGGILR